MRLRCTQRALNLLCGFTRLLNFQRYLVNIITNDLSPVEPLLAIQLPDFVLTPVDTGQNALVDQ